MLFFYLVLPLKKIFLIFVATTLLAQAVLAAHRHPEKYYQDKWCAEHNGQAEVVLADKTRADCITATHAIEFDFGKKWAESIGQSLYYSLLTGKRAGIVLILEKPEDWKYFIRLNITIQHFKLPVGTWGMAGE